MTEKIQNQTFDTYPIKLKNQLRSVYDRSKIMILNGKEEGKEILKARHLINQLPDFPYGQSEITTDSARYRAGLVSITETLLEQDKGYPSYIAGIGSADYKNLPAIASEITQQNAGQLKVVNRIVFGGTTDMQLRALSYLLPALSQMEAMSKNPLGNLEQIQAPQLQVVFANYIAADINKLPYEVLREQSKQYTDIARAFIRQYYPLQDDNIVFLEDTNTGDKASFLSNQLMQLQPVIAASISEETKNRLRKKNRAGDPDISLTYAAAHLLMHDTNMPGIIAPFDLNQSEAVTPSSIISFGGMQERDFYAVRHDARQNLQGELANQFTTVGTLQYFTKHSVPPYYAAKNGDISLEQAINNPDVLADAPVDKAAEFDLIYLDDISRQRGKPFGEFLKEYRKEHKYV